MDNLQDLQLLNHGIPRKFFSRKIFLYVMSPKYKQVCVNRAKLIQPNFSQSHKLINRSPRREITLTSSSRDRHVFNHRNNPVGTFILGNGNLANGKSGRINLGTGRSQWIGNKVASSLSNPAVALLNSHVPELRTLSLIDTRHVTSVTRKPNQIKSISGRLSHHPTNLTLVSYRGFKSHPVRVLSVSNLQCVDCGSVPLAHLFTLKTNNYHGRRVRLSRALKGIK